MNIISFLANDNYIVVNRDLIKEFGINAALLLGELASEYNYYSKTNELVDDMFYSTVDNIKNKTGLSKYQQSEAMKKLEKIGIVKTILKGCPAKRYIKLEAEKIETFLSNDSTSSGKKTRHLEVKELDTNNNNGTVINNNNKDIAAKPRTRFTPPTLEEVKAYCEERNNGIDAQHFIDYYSARGWELSKGRKVRDWKACVRTWENNSYNRKPTKQAEKPQQKPKEINVDDFRRADGTIDCDAYMRAQYS